MQHGFFPKVVIVRGMDTLKLEFYCGILRDEMNNISPVDLAENKFYKIKRHVVLIRVAHKPS